jgi:hypothetical protein
MGHALAPSADSAVVIESQGVAHTIRFTIDPVRQTPVINRDAAPSAVKIGARVTVQWPDSPRSSIAAAKDGFFSLAEAYGWLNPHLTINVDWRANGQRHWEWQATDPDWTKWRPSQPSSAHWYDVERLSRHVAAEIAFAEDRRKPCMSVRDFIGQFRGLSGTAKQNAICTEIGVAERETLAEFYRDRLAPARLLTAMRARSNPVKPRDLGLVGESHVRERMLDDGCDPDSIVYRKREIEHDAPYMIELAFGYRPDEAAIGRYLIEGFNFAPAIGGSPFQLEQRLAGLDVDEDDPVTVFAHLTSPRLSFTDKGKAKLDLPLTVAGEVRTMLALVTKAWTKQKTAEIRDHNARLRRAEAVGRKAKPMSQVEAVRQHVERAYKIASASNQYPANKRQIYYAIREAVEQATGRKLDSKYFSGTLLPDYIKAHPRETADWDVVADDRGHFAEPHTGKRIGVGTLAVRAYIEEIAEPEIAEIDIAEVEVVTKGPAARYGSILYIEKEGFDPIIEAAGIPEEFDIAPMSCKGMSVIAARTMVEALCAKHGLGLFILRDFDVTGFTIKKTLHTSGKRYTFKRKVEAVDLGLRLDDIEWFAAQGHPLATETVDFGKTSKAAIRARLRNDGATEAEIDFLTTGPGNTGRRVELNAMASDVFVAFVRRKLALHGAVKVIPSSEMLAEAFTAFKRGAMAKAALEAELERLNAEPVAIPGDLDQRVQAYLAANPKATWDEAVRAIMEASGKK